jgi:drug/metabolite transporter (DMT)-like permease
MNWTLFDFVVAGGLLTTTLMAGWVIFRRGHSAAHRLAGGLAALGALVMVWANGAVGLVSTPDDSANLLLLGVLPIGLMIAVIERFRAEGLVRGFAVMAVLQLAAGITIFAMGWGADGAAWPFDLLGVTLVYAGLWGACAWLMRRGTRPLTDAS